MVSGLSNHGSIVESVAESWQEMTAECILGGSFDSASLIDAVEICGCPEMEEGEKRGPGQIEFWPCGLRSRMVWRVSWQQGSSTRFNI